MTKRIQFTLKGSLCDKSKNQKRIVRLPTTLKTIGYKNGRLSRAFSEVFKEKPDYKHVDKHGARLIRGSQY